MKKIFFRTTFLLTLSLCTFNVCAQENCKTPVKIYVDRVTSSVIEVSCKNIPHAYSYIARVKMKGDTVWNYMRVNAPDTLFRFEKLTPGRIHLIQMGTMCSYNLKDTSAFTPVLEVCTSFPCEPPATFVAENITPNTVLIKWSFGFNAKSYRLFYRKTSDEKGVWISVSLDASATPQFLLENLSPDTEYECSIRCNCSGKSGGVSELYKPTLIFKTKNTR